MKIRTLIVCLSAAVCAAKPAFAQISANTDAGSDAVIISGTVLHDEAQIVLLKPGSGISDAENAAASADKTELENVIEYFGQVSAKNKNIETLIPMRADAEKGKYLLIVDDELYTVYFAALKERQENLLPAAKAALSNGSFTQFAEDDGKYFCNSDLYDSLSNGANAAKYAADILDDSQNASDTEFVSNMSSALNMGIIMEALNENKINDLITLRAMTDTSGMAVPLDKAELIESDKVNNIISDISGKGFASPEEYKKLLSESIFMNVFYNAADMSNADKKAFFETYAAQLGLKLSSYEKLSENKKTEAIAKLSTTNCTSLKLMQSSLDDICKSIASTNSAGGGGGSGSGGGGGGGSSGGGSGSIRAVNSNAAVANNESGGGKTTAGGLTDLSECEWARPAIEYLTGCGMINGYEDNTFKPLRNISRAEFISILARKYLPQNDYAQSFSDVEPGSWCFGHIESAFNNGIITGKGDNIFAPDENISRQDMSVILYRLAGFLGRELSGAPAEFTDDADIADYAKNAVYSLKAAGIVNGYENGKFDPGANATRAETAQMIYNFVRFLD